MRARRLIEGYRTYGHLMATDNPLVRVPAEGPPQLQLKRYGIRKEELSLSRTTFRFLPEERAPFESLLNALKETYSGKVGIEYVGSGSFEMEQWIQDQIEPAHPKSRLSIAQKQTILQQLNKSELFEAFLHTKYVGQKRFSLERGLRSGSPCFPP